jgi:AICAR transformylase/IMP cyclohydrolase PurH/REP element-mobilizing transposase RayT
MLDGRVKTLHPKIHAAILADRDNAEHMRQLEEHGIKPIDMVVVNLYPFEKTVADPNCKFEDAIEMIDIGGPCLLRAAAKNHRHVLVVSCDPAFYQIILGYLRMWNEQIHRVDALIGGAFCAFDATASYDAAVTSWLSDKEARGEFLVRYLRLWNAERLRYGENPHQAATLWYTSPRTRGLDLTAADAGVSDYSGSQGVMSSNNYADADAALGLCAELTRAAGKAKLVQETAKLLQGTAKLCFAEGTTRLRLVEEAGAKSSLIRDEVFTRHKLPHWQRPGATYWVTFSSAIGELTPDERDIALSALKYWDGKKLTLISAVVMPDHVHALIEPRHVKGRWGGHEDLSKLLHSIKTFSGREISQRRGGVGQVWLRETYDRWIRSDEDLEEKYRYLANNPVKEGLAATPQEYKWWYGLDVLGIGLGLPVSSGELATKADQMSETVLRPPENKAEPCSTLDKAEPRSTLDKAEPRSTLDKAEPRSTLDKAEPCRTCAALFIKHTNACGVGIAEEPIEAYRRAYLGDPNAAMGGILAVNFAVSAEFAATVMETYDRFGKAAGAGGFFVEVWVAPSFDDEAVEVIRGKKVGAPVKKWGEKVRLLAVGDMAAEPDPNDLDYKRIAGGMLVQTRDLVGLNEDQWKVVTRRAPTESEISDLRLAWLIAKHTKSNAISLCKDGMLIGNGAGQMSRVMSCRIATWLSKENGHADKLATGRVLEHCSQSSGTSGDRTQGAGTATIRVDGPVAASDAFFPFRDGPDILLDAGITAIIQPGGSKRDEETIQACDERGAAMIFTGTRHFKH